MALRVGSDNNKQQLAGTHGIQRGGSPSTGKRTAHDILLLCTTAEVSSKDKEKLSQILAKNVDWKYLLDLAGFHGIKPLIAYNLITNGFTNKIPQPYLDQLNKMYNSALYRSSILSSELTEVLSTFSQRGIAVIPLKGIILAEILYGNPALRNITDLDIMVNPKDIPAARSILTELGYKQITIKSKWDHSFHEIPYYKIVNFPVFIELHWELDDSKMIAFPAKQIWNRTQVLQLHGSPTTVLSPEDNLLFLACHLFKHDDQLLKFLADIAELLKKYDGLLDWDYITESIHAWQIETYVYYSLKLARELLGAPAPVSTLETLRPSLWRLCTLGLLLDNEFFISPVVEGRFRSWTSVLAWSLMSKHLHQTRNVLLRHEGARKRVAWPKILVWIMLVLAAALGRYLIKITIGRINRGLPNSTNNASG